jgi:hypothetical protein
MKTEDVVKLTRWNMHNSSYCDLQPLNTFFNDKPLYKCNYCGLTVGLEIPDTKILCFKKMEDIANKIHKIHRGEESSTQQTQHLTENQNISDVILNKIVDNTKEQYLKAQNSDNPDNLCSTEQIEHRLSICNSCEYFQNNSCLLCGCTVIRDANHQNKLAHKDQKCPADKWGPIV